MSSFHATESEYMAASSAAQEATHLRNILEDLGHKQNNPTIIREDNKGSIHLTENPVQNSRLKHMRVEGDFAIMKLDCVNNTLSMKHIRSNTVTLHTMTITPHLTWKIHFNLYYANESVMISPITQADMF